MIQSPKNLTEQLLNLCERLAVEMRALFNTVDTKLGKTEKATSAKTADTATTSVTATKATQDASGNIITSTYATKNEVTKGLAGKAPMSHTHTKSQITDFPEIPDTSTLIPKTGNRGALAGYSTSTSGYTVKNSTEDSQFCTKGTITVFNGVTGQTWTKVVKMSGGTITLGSYWTWVDGEVPELTFPCILICHWNEDKGIAGIVKGAS